MKKHTAFQAIVEAMGLMNRGVIWAPLLFYLAIKIGILILYRSTFLGPLGGAWASLLQADLRENLTHYPWDLAYMPVILGRVAMPIDVFVGSVFRGATIVLFAKVLTEARASLSPAFRVTRGRYVGVVVVALVPAVLLAALARLHGLATGSEWAALPTPSHVALGSLAGILVQTFFLYALPFVVLTGHSAPAALIQSVSWARRSFRASLILVVVPFLVMLPALLLGLQSAALVARLSPEIMIPLQIVSEVAAWLSTMILIGGLTVWFVRRRGRELVV